MSRFECKRQGSGPWQIGLAQHGGGSPSGESCFALTVAEAARYALRNKAFRWVYAALGHALSALPLPAHVFHAGNGSEFINHALCLRRKGHSIVLTGSRKNGNCFIEQKNYASARKIIGYGRLSGEMALVSRAAGKLPALSDPVPGFAGKRALKPLPFGSYGLIF